MMKKRILVLFVILVVFVLGLPGKPRAAEAPTVSDLELSMNPSADQPVEDIIYVTTGVKSKLFLQWQDPDSGEWKSKVRYTLRGTGQPEEIRLHYPKEIASRTETVWRLYIPETAGTPSYTSPDIHLITSNVQTLSLSATHVAVLRESDGAVMYRLREHEEKANASTTKMMTALLVLEGLENGTLSMMDEVTASAEAASTPYGKLYAHEGQRFYLRDLLYGMLVRSLNDGASILAEHVGGTIKDFVGRMNDRAAQLGMGNTQFKNPHGLDEDGHYSSAYDLCLLQRECYKNSLYRKILKWRSCSFWDLDRTKEYYFYTTDDLLYTDLWREGFGGGKTGFTDNAGQCFCGVWEQNGETYYIAVLGSPDPWMRWDDVVALIHYIQQNG